MVVGEFQRFLHQKGEELYRDMPWREDTRAYYVLVSELMLQQTQVARVIPKFTAFIERFPDEKILAQANLADVVRLWQGLGYNRRAKYLHEAAKMIVGEFNSVFPDNEKNLLRLPGVGRNTAGAILAYSFNQPSIFIETNIRTIYMHHFFADRHDVDDKEIFALLEETLDYENPRRFYQNLMDYGSYLKGIGIKNISSSRHYKKQPPLKGSVREVRGAILRHLAEGDVGASSLRKLFADDVRFDAALKGLQADGLILLTGHKLHLRK